MKKNLFVLFALFCLGIGSGKAQFTDIYNFNGTKGAEPFGTLIGDARGVLYGTAYLGGANDSGCVFSIHSDGTHYKDLYDFSGPNGSHPNSPLTLVRGVLYGSANTGGLHDSGCIFAIDTNGSNYRNLLNFTGPNGKNPYNSLIYKSGYLYGVADGGANHVGCIFYIDTTGSGYRDIFDFNTTNGSYPLGLTFAKGKLYGTTLEGGLYTYGIVFSIDTNGSGFTNLLNFDITNGLYPSGPVIYTAGVLYGATSDGGAHSEGILFSIDTTGGNFKDLFDFSGTNGSQPEYAGGALVLNGNMLYGSTYYGAAHDSGCIFSIDTNGTRYSDLYDFTGPQGANPEGSLTLLGSTLYGATAGGGTTHQGVIFSFDTAVVTTTAIRDSICPRDSALVFVSGIRGATFRWSPGGATKDSIYVHPVSSTIYTVTTTQGVTTYTNTVKVTVVPLPTPVLSGTSYVCRGHKDTVNVSGATKYKWSDGKTSGTSYYTGDINADSTIYLTAYNALGCSVTDTFKIRVDSNCITTGINQLQYANQIQIFPNPNNGVFTLQSSGLSGKSSVEIYSVLGERIYAHPFTSQNPQFTIDLSNQPEGIYLYRVLDENGNSIGTGKLIIQK